MKKQVLCFGEILWDTFEYEKTPGGAPMNVARHLAQQGIKTQFASRLGNDLSGRELALFLQDTGLYSNLIQQDDKLPTCEVVIELDNAGQATYVIPKPVSWDNIELTDNLLTAASNAKAIVFGSLASRSPASRNTLRTLLDESPAIKIFDVNLRHPHYELATIELLAAKANVIKMNEEEATLLIGSSSGKKLQQKVLEFQKTYHNHTIIITRGADGAMVWHDEKFYEHPGIKVNAVDTVGSGDAFLATFIAGMLSGTSIPALLAKACSIGAFVATQRGANPVYPAEVLS